MPWTKNFDVDRALERAGEVFWNKGYMATTLRDLLGAMGIQKASFYDTYGNKHAAYLSALEQYSQARSKEFGDLIDGLGPLEAVRAIFDAILEDCLSPQGQRGCMVINCALELAPHDPEAQAAVLRAFKDHENLYRDLIRAGQERGEIPDHLNAHETAKLLLGLVMGMRVYARAGAPRKTLRTLADQALALLGG